MHKDEMQKATLQLKPDAHPIFKKKRPVPFAYVAALDEEIDRLLAEQVLSPVDYSAWAAPIVVVKKSNGTLRLCADFSTGLNDALMLHQHPLPTPAEFSLVQNVLLLQSAWLAHEVLLLFLLS